MRKFYILLFFILFISILSLNVNNSYAYTLEDYKDFCQFTKDNNINSIGTNYNNARNQFLSIYSLITQKIGDEVDDFNNFYLYYDGSSRPYVLYLINGSIIYSCDANNKTYVTSNQQSGLTIKKLKWASGISNINSFTYESTTTINLGANTFCLFDGEPTNYNYYNALMQNQWVYTLNIYSVYNELTSNLPWVIGDVKIPINFAGSSIELWGSGDNYFDNDFHLTESSAVAGSLYRYSITTTRNLINHAYYYLRVKYNDTYIKNSDLFQLNWVNDSSGGGSSGSSGDNNGVCNCSMYLQTIIDLISGDLIISINNNTNQLKENNEAIQDIFNNAFNSGESGEKGFIQKIYDSLFRMSSGDFEDIYALVKDNYEDNFSGEGLLPLYIELYDIWTSHEGDFIISWDNIPINLTFFNGSTLVSGDIIPSGEVNFSALCRDNETLNTIKFWVNVILSMSLFIIVIVEIWSLHLKMLGISSSYINNQDDEEATIIDTISDTSMINKSTGEVTESKYLRHTTTTRKRK